MGGLRARLEDVKAISGITLGLQIAFLFFARADDPVNLAGGPPAVPLDLNEAYGRLEIVYLAVPEEKMTAFADCFDAPGGTPNLDDILKRSGGKRVASATTSLTLGGDGAMLEIAESRLTLRPRIVSPTEFHLEGRLTRASFSSTFDVLLTPGQYQLFLLWEQPPHAGMRDPYNAVVARMREISVKGANGEVRTLIANPGPPPPAPPPGLTPPAPLSSPKTGKLLYENRGDNTKGFVVKYNTGNFTPENNMLVANDAGHHVRDDDNGWCALPVSVTGDFQIDFDVFPDANDANCSVYLFDDGSNQGVQVINSTNTSFGTHSLYINGMNDLTNYDQLFGGNHTTFASAESKQFANQAWTHITISKKGHTLTDNVGGQIISAELPPDELPRHMRVGLGYYATKNVGGNGQMSFTNIRVVKYEVDVSR